MKDPASSGPFMLAFTMLGFPVRVQGTFFVVSFLFGVMGGRSATFTALWVAIIAASILWHELGHALCARRFGLSASIELNAMGGLTFHEAPPEGAWRQSLWIALAGPGAGFVLGAAIWLYALLNPQRSATISSAISAALWVNVGWGLVNLLPILPLDGGQALRSLLQRIAPLRWDWWSQSVSMITGASAVALAANEGMIWAAYLAATSTFRSAQALLALRASSRLDDAYANLRAGKLREAEETLRKRRIRSDGTAPELLELSAWTRLYAGDVMGAKEFASALGPAQVPSAELQALLDLLAGQTADLRPLNQAILLAYLPPMVAAWPVDNGCYEKLMAPSNTRLFDLRLLQRIDATLFYSGQYARALQVATEAFEIHRDPTDAYNAACSQSKLGNQTEALDWLQRAVGAGFKDLELLRNDDDLAPLRNNEKFVALTDQLSRP